MHAVLLDLSRVFDSISQIVNEETQRTQKFEINDEQSHWIELAPGVR